MLHEKGRALLFVVMCGGDCEEVSCVDCDSEQAPYYLLLYVTVYYGKE